MSWHLLNGHSPCARAQLEGRRQGNGNCFPLTLQQLSWCPTATITVSVPKSMPVATQPPPGLIAAPPVCSEDPLLEPGPPSSSSSPHSRGGPQGVSAAVHLSLCRHMAQCPVTCHHGCADTTKRLPKCTTPQEAPAPPLAPAPPRWQLQGSSLSVLLQTGLEGESEVLVLHAPTWIQSMTPHMAPLNPARSGP